MGHKAQPEQTSSGKCPPRTVSTLSAKWELSEGWRGKGILDSLGFWSVLFGVVRLFYFPNVFWPFERMEKLAFNESGGFFPIQSGQEGYTADKTQPPRSLGSWAFRATKTCFDLLLDSLQTAHTSAKMRLLLCCSWLLLLPAKEDGALCNGKAAAGRQAPSMTGLQVWATSLRFQP